MSTGGPFAIVEQPRAVPAALLNGDLEARLRRAVVANGRQIGQLQDRLEQLRGEQGRFLVDLLDVADAIDRVTAALAEAQDGQLRAVRATGRLLQQVLRRRGVSRVDLVGRVLDPEVADVESVVLDASVPVETVVRELSPAYTWEDRVLRRGRVVVSKQTGP